MKVTFYGAAREVTGSSYLVETTTKTILIDCGLFQGGRMSEARNSDPFSFDPASVDVVCITHAHLDHCGRLPRLVQKGFHGRILATGPTIRLMQLMLEDSAHLLIQEAEHHHHEPVYTVQDVERMNRLCEEASYHEVVRIDENITVEFFDAGHILGSSMIRVTADGTSIVFSGDIGNPPVPILNPTEHIDHAEYVVMESTYGDRVHEDKETRTLLLQSAIYETAIMKGVLMIPAFAMERTQELLYEINELMNNKDIPPIPIFLDSPLAIKATAVFKEFQEYFNPETKTIIESGDDVFHFPGLRQTLNTEDSKAINDYPAPKIIIAGSGMAQGGRILHHIERYISFFANQYLIVGFQVQGSLGRRLLDGEKQVTIHGKPIDVHAKVRAIGGYSAHADKPKLTSWIQGFDSTQLKRVFITHGEEGQAIALQEHFRQNISADVTVPVLGESFELN